MTDPIDKPKTQPTAKRELASNRRRFDSRQLFDTQNEIVIVHRSDEYRLRITSNGKLILTK